MKANILRSWSNILLDPTETKPCVIAAVLFDLDGNMHCLMRLLVSRDIKISVVSKCSFLVPIEYMNTQPFAFFSADILHGGYTMT